LTTTQGNALTSTQAQLLTQAQIDAFNALTS
jgi:hypothetical protein